MRGVGRSAPNATGRGNRCLFHRRVGQDIVHVLRLLSTFLVCALLTDLTRHQQRQVLLPPLQALSFACGLLL